jgi:hypothetical protein
MACGVFYIIGNFLKRRCLKWAHITHLESEAQIMAKRRAGSQNGNLTPDHKKSGIDPICLAAGGVPHTIGKLLTRATTLLQTTLRSEVFLQSYGAPKSRESHLVRFRDSHLRVLGEKNHLYVASMASHRVYYKGEGGGFPQVRAMVRLVCRCCSWLI